MEAVSQFQRNWKDISKFYFPNRSRLDLSNRYNLLYRKRCMEPVIIKLEPLAMQFQQLYPSESPEASNEDATTQRQQLHQYDWNCSSSVSASPAQSIAGSSRSVRSHGPAKTSQLQLTPSRHNSIDARGNYKIVSNTPASSPQLQFSSPRHNSIDAMSEYDLISSGPASVVSSSSGGSVSAGFVIDQHPEHPPQHPQHPHHNRLHSAPPMFHQPLPPFVSLSQTAMLEAAGSSRHPSFAMSPMLGAESVMRSAINGHSSPIMNSPSPMTHAQSHGRSSSMHLMAHHHHHHHHPGDSALLYNAVVNQGTQIPLAFNT
jgi:hypothetical protein